MIRIFLPSEQLQSDQITITGEQARHLSVLRVKPSEVINVFDGQGYKYECKILQVHKKEVIAELIRKAPYSVESPLSVTLAQGLPKGDKMDFILQKTTELGVSSIIPLYTERSQVHHTHKIERWRKIALSASQQSGRDKVPDISEPLKLEDYLDQHIPPAATGYITDLKGVTLDSDARLILSEGYQERNLKQVLKGLANIGAITLLIGPEGGFSGDEIRMAVERGFVEVSIGPRILRTETAPLAAMSIIQYELGDVG